MTKYSSPLVRAVRIGCLGYKPSSQSVEVGLEIPHPRSISYEQSKWWTPDIKRHTPATLFNVLSYFTVEFCLQQVMNGNKFVMKSQHSI